VNDGNLGTHSARSSSCAVCGAWLTGAIGVPACVATRLRRGRALRPEHLGW